MTNLEKQKIVVETVSLIWNQIKDTNPLMIKAVVSGILDGQETVLKNLMDYEEKQNGK